MFAVSQINMSKLTSSYPGVIVLLLFTVTHVVENYSVNCNQKCNNKITQRIIDSVNATRIRQYLIDLSAKPHLAGMNDNLAEYVHDIWIQQELDNVKYYSYNVLLSYPDWNNPNQVGIINKTTSEVIFSAAGKQKPLHSPEESDATIVPNFHAYSRAGKIKGDLVYAHYGRESDFQWLQQQGINLTGTIIIARNGAIFRGDTALFAERNGASGLILYSDPEDFAPYGPNDVYPNSIWLPGSAIQYGTLALPFGDPLTPNYPSKEGMYRIGIKDAHLPGIPVQPISYDDAEEFLKLMGGRSSPPEWSGTLKAPYNIGPGFTDNDLKVKLSVQTSDQMKTITNVITVIPGNIEPDRYVILGNHRDAWALGAMDPSSGTAVLLEVTRIFSQLYKEGWKPRRSLIFASWDAEEYNAIGSQEWVEEFLNVIKDRTIAYLNIDMAVQGRFSLNCKGLPTLHRVAYEAAKKVPNPDLEELSQGRKTIYDTWVHRNPDTHSTTFNDTVPKIYIPGIGSDYAPFLHVAGVPILDLRYVSNTSNPLYHTLYETFYEMDVLVDPGFRFHAAMAQLWAEMARSLADAELLPLNVEDYGIFLLHALQEIKSKYGVQLKKHGVSLKYIEAAVHNFAATSKAFQQKLELLDYDNPIEIRAANDKLMQVERAFLKPEGLPNRNYLKHVVFAPSSLNEYGSSIFSSITDSINSTSQDWDLVTKELATVAHCITSAANILLEL